jgi:hypothetical protein
VAESLSLSRIRKPEEQVLCTSLDYDVDNDGNCVSDDI